jgi:hypothetical protein
VRERLFSHYKTSLDDYYKAIVSMLDEVGIEEATYQTRRLYDACVVARFQVQQHEQEHGCAIRRDLGGPDPK